MFAHIGLLLSVLLAQDDMNGDLGREGETSITSLFYNKAPLLHQ